MQPILRLLLAICIGAVLAACSQYRDITGADSDYTRLNTARFILSDDHSPPAVGRSGWSFRKLPDNWNATLPDQGGVAWYRLNFESGKADGLLWAVFLPSVNMTADVYVNSVLIGSGGRFDEPLARNWFRPLIFNFPSSLLHAGRNRIDIRLAAYPNDGGGLSTVMVGHAKALQPLYEQLWRVKIMASVVMFIIAIAIALFIVIFVLFRPMERYYLWLAGSAFFCALFSLNFFLKNIPFDRHLWESMTQISLGMIVYCLMMFANRLLQLNHRRLETISTLFFPLLGFLLMLVPEMWLVSVYEWWQAGSIVLVVVMLIVVSHSWKRQQSVDAAAVALGFLCLFLSGLHDWLIAKLHMDYMHLYLQFAPFAVVMVISVLWLSKLVVALNGFEHINRNLTRLVEEKSAFLQQALLDVEQASAEKTRFFAAASHDLRQPLHAMSLFLSGMEGHFRDEKGAMLAAKVRQGIDLLRSMFDQMLDISKFETGTMDVNTTLFPLAPLFERMQNEYASLFREKGLKLRVFTTDVCLVTDAMLLERILRNLVENALRYTERGGVLIGCRRRNDTVLIEVWDSGSGIPESELSTIFDEFHRLNHGVEVAGSGAGLGLSIVRRIARLLFLKLSVRSRPGRGTVFSVAVPAGEAPLMAPPPSPQPEGRNLPAIALEGARIWVVDDEQIALEGMEVLLESWGCLCRCFGSLQQVTAFMDSHAERPDMMVSDYSLQDGCNGPALIRKVRQLAGEQIAAILVTGSDSVDTYDSGIPVLRKPVDPHQLYDTIESMLDKATQRRAPTSG